MKIIFVIIALILSTNSVKAQYIMIWQHQYKRDKIWPSLIVCFKYDNVKAFVDTSKIADRVTKKLVTTSKKGYESFENFMKKSKPKIKNSNADYSFIVTIFSKNNSRLDYSIPHESYMNFLKKIKAFTDVNFDTESQASFNSYYNIISGMLMPSSK